MALTSAQQLSCYEIANVIYSDSAVVQTGFGAVLTLTEVSTLKNTLATYLTGLDADAVTKVQTIVTEWDAVVFNTVQIQAGGGSSMSGVNFDSNEHRKRLKEVFLIYVPVMTIFDSVLRRQGGSMASGGSRSIPMSGRA